MTAVVHTGDVLVVIVVLVCAIVLGISLAEWLGPNDDEPRS